MTHAELSNQALVVSNLARIEGFQNTSNALLEFVRMMNIDTEGLGDATEALEHLSDSYKDLL